MSDSKDFTIFIRNFDSKKVTHDLLLELFTQAGPVQNLTLKEDFAFLEFEDKESVMYACNLLNETLLFGVPLQVKPRNGSIWENEEFFKFPNQNTVDEFVDDNNQFFGNDEQFNEVDYRQNDCFIDNNNFYEQPNKYRQQQHNRSQNSFVESDYRQQHPQQHNRSLNNYDPDYRQPQQQQQQHNRSLNSFSEPDYWQHQPQQYQPQQQQQHNRSLNSFSESDYRQPQQQNRLSYSNFQDVSDYRYVAPDASRQNRQPQKVQQDRRFDQWVDSRPTMNKSFGSYRDRPY